MNVFNTLYKTDKIYICYDLTMSTRSDDDLTSLNDGHKITSVLWGESKNIRNIQFLFFVSFLNSNSNYF